MERLWRSRSLVLLLGADARRRTSVLQATAGLRDGFKSNTLGPACLSLIVRRFRTPLVKATRKPKQKPKRDLLVGTWLNGSEYASDVEFTITRSGDSYAIRLRDGYDGEESEVFDTAWNGEVLSFATHWKSTGRFARY